MPSAEHVAVVRFCSSSDMHIELCYQCFGDPCKKMPVLLLIGGLNMQMYAWDEAFCEKLVDQGFFVIRFDNRDIGHSSKIENRGRVSPLGLLLPKVMAFGERLPYTIEDIAHDAIALLDTLGVHCAHVMGISMGGMVAQTLALLAPQRVLSLTSIMSTTNAPDLPDPSVKVKLWLLRKPPKNATTDEIIDYRIDALKWLLSDALAIDVEYLRQRYRVSMNRSSYTEGLIRQAAAIRRCPGRDDALRSLSCPTLVVHGEKDVLMRPEHGHRTASVIRQAKLVTLKSMGHYFHPAFFDTVVSHFVALSKQVTDMSIACNRVGLNVLSFTPKLDTEALKMNLNRNQGEKESGRSDTGPHGLSMVTANA